MDLVSVHVPAWFAMAIAGIYTCLLVGLIAARWTTDARILVALPLLVGTAAGSYAVFDALRFVEWGATAGPVTRAAVVVEALLPVFHGAVVATILSSAAACAWDVAPARRRRTRAGSVMLAAGAIIVVAWIAFIWQFAHTPFPPRAYFEPGFLGFSGLAVASIVAAVLVAFGPFRASESADSPRRWFVVLAVLTAVAALGLRAADYQLRGFIMR